VENYSTKVTAMNGKWICAVLLDGKVIVQGTVSSREDIGPAFRDLLRTLDKYTIHTSKFAEKSRRRITKPGNRCLKVKHEWPARQN